MARTFRRVVTGHDADGKAVCISDAPAAKTMERRNRPGVTFTDFWQTDSLPAEYDGPPEMAEGPFLLHPPRHGSVFRIVEFGPEDPERLRALDGKAAYEEMGAGHSFVENARHPFMHRTDTVDYAIVLEGEITLLLDDSEVELKAGDVVVQRGTNHAWSNRGPDACLVAFVQIDAVAKA